MHFYILAHGFRKFVAYFYFSYARFGHSQIDSLLWRLEEDGKAIFEGHLPMRDAYFAPERIIHEGGIDPIIRGSFAQPAQKVDTKVRLGVIRVS